MLRIRGRQTLRSLKLDRCKSLEKCSSSSGKKSVTKKSNVPGIIEGWFSRILSQNWPSYLGSLRSCCVSIYSFSAIFIRFHRTLKFFFLRGSRCLAAYHTLTLPQMYPQASKYIFEIMFWTYSKVFFHKFKNFHVNEAKISSGLESLRSSRPSRFKNNLIISTILTR